MEQISSQYISEIDDDREQQLICHYDARDYQKELSFHISRHCILPLTAITSAIATANIPEWFSYFVRIFQSGLI